MSPIVALLGAAGATGQRIAGALDRRGTSFLAVDDAPVPATVTRRSTVAGVRTLDVGDRSSLHRLLDEVDLVVSTGAPSSGPGREVLEAAIATGTAYVDTAAEPAFLAWAHLERAADARDAGTTVVPGIAADVLVGDLLAALAAEGGPAPDAVHVTYAAPGVRFGRTTAHTRRRLAGWLGTPVLVHRDGALLEERLAEARRLAWFPRPVGPRHAAAVPGGEAITVPRHLAGVGTVRTYLSLSTAMAETVQTLGNVSRWDPARRGLLRVLHAMADRPTDPATTRWACVAEAASGGRLGRAWAYGHDPSGVTAEAAAAVATRVLAGGGAPGVLPPATAVAPDVLLDDLAARTGLRWGRTRSDRRAG